MSKCFSGKFTEYALFSKIKKMPSTFKIYRKNGTPIQIPIKLDQCIIQLYRF